MNRCFCVIALCFSVAGFARAESAPAALYVNPAWVVLEPGADPAGPASSFGLDSFSTVQAAINAAEEGSTLSLAAGLYDECLTISKGIRLVGPAADPVAGGDPTAIIRPTHKPATGRIITVVNPHAGTPIKVELINLFVDGEPAGKTNPYPYIQLDVAKGVELSVSNSRFTYAKWGGTLGMQTGWAMMLEGVKATIRNSRFDTFSKSAIASYGTGETHIFGCLIEGADLSTTYHFAQDGVEYNEQVTGEIRNTVFRNFDFSGHRNQAYGGARVADDGSYGTVIKIRGSALNAAAVVLANNLFENVHSAVYVDWRYVSGLGVYLTPKSFFDSGNKISGSHTVIGTMKEGHAVFGDTSTDPNYINFLILQAKHDGVLTLSGGTELSPDQNLTDPENKLRIQVQNGEAALVLNNEYPLENIVFGRNVRVKYRPRVSLVSPLQGAKIMVDSAVEVSAAADNADHSIARVDFLVNGESVASVSSAPYSFTWTPSAEGACVVKALAITRDGLERLSGEVAIVVGPKPFGITWEMFTINGTGSTVESLFTSEAYPDAPVRVEMLNEFSAPRGVGDKYAARIRGFIVPPVNGAYTFFLSGDDHAELWISSDEGRESLVRRAFVRNAAFGEWKGGSAQSLPMTLEAGKSYYLEVYHAQCIGTDHVSVGWKLPDGSLERPIPGTRLLPYIDSDLDTLSAWEEMNLYYTSPNTDDTDGDGLNDDEEIYLAKTDPTVKNTLTTVAQVGAERARIVAGAWTAEGEELASSSHAGILEYDFTVTGKGKGAEDVYRLLLPIRRTSKSAYTQVYTVRYSIDGQFAGVQRLNLSTKKDSRSILYTPYLTKGSHTLRLDWFNVYPDTGITVKPLKVQRVGGEDKDGNGRPDWQDRRYAAHNAVHSVPAESLVSPLCLEGRALTRSAVRVRGDEEAARPVLCAVATGWYANVPLAPEGDTPISVIFENGAYEEKRRTCWARTNIFTTSALELRTGDALKLAAFNGDVAGEVPVKLQVTFGSVLQDYEVTADGYHSFTFASAGIYQVTAEAVSPSGDEYTSTLEVTVVEVQDTGLVAAEGVTRSWRWPNLPAGIRVDTGEYRYHGETGRFVSYDEYDQGYIVARLGAGGSILKSFKPEVFTVYSVVRGYLEVVATYPDGASEIENTIYLSRRPAALGMTLSINTGGAVFGTGSLMEEINMEDFTDLGAYTYRVMRPAGKTTSCHFITVKDCTDPAKPVAITGM